MEGILLLGGLVLTVVGVVAEKRWISIAAIIAYGFGSLLILYQLRGWDILTGFFLLATLGVLLVIGTLQAFEANPKLRRTLVWVGGLTSSAWVVLVILSLAGVVK